MKAAVISAGIAIASAIVISTLASQARIKHEIARLESLNGSMRKTQIMAQQRGAEIADRIEVLRQEIEKLQQGVSELQRDLNTLYQETEESHSIINGLLKRPKRSYLRQAILPLIVLFLCVLWLLWADKVKNMVRESKEEEEGLEETERGRQKQKKPPLEVVEKRGHSKSSS